MEPRTSKIAGPFAYLVAYLTHLHPKPLVSLPRQRHLRTLLHNNKLLIEKNYYYFNYLQYDTAKINK